MTGQARHQRYNYLLSDWNEAKEQARQLLIANAKLGDRAPRLSYSDGTRAIEPIQFSPNGADFHYMLYEISVDEDTAGRGLLTALVVHKIGDMIPGKGFGSSWVPGW